MTKMIAGMLLVLVLGCGCQPSVEQLKDVSDDIGQRVKDEAATQENRAQAMVKCQELCQNILFSDGDDFVVGPCLDNSIAPGWVCDVAHDPHQPVDNDPANQCSAFRDGTAQHFVEVDGNCNVIKAQ